MAYTKKEIRSDLAVERRMEKIAKLKCKCGHLRDDHTCYGKAPCCDCECQGFDNPRWQSMI